MSWLPERISAKSKGLRGEYFNYTPGLFSRAG